MKKTLLILSASSLLLLQGCGGGGGNDSDTSAANGGDNANTTTPGNNGGSNTGTGGNGPGGADQGSVSALFVRGDASYFMLSGIGFQSAGALSSSEQIADGAMISLDDDQLSGDYAVQDIAGDASFAIGRWTKGTVTTRTGGNTLTGTNGFAYHYIAYQIPSAFPNGSLHCGGGNFTTATGGTAAQTGTVTGTADIVFSDGSGALSGSVTVNAKGETAIQALPVKLSSPSSIALTGINGANPYAFAQLADAGNGVYGLAVQFNAVVPSGAHYIGVGRLICTQAAN